MYLVKNEDSSILHSYLTCYNASGQKGVVKIIADQGARNLLSRFYVVVGDHTIIFEQEFSTKLCESLARCAAMSLLITKREIVK